MSPSLGLLSAAFVLRYDPKLLTLSVHKGIFPRLCINGAAPPGPELKQNLSGPAGRLVRRGDGGTEGRRDGGTSGG